MNTPLCVFIESNLKICAHAVLQTLSWGTAMVSLLVALSVKCKHNKNCTIAEETKNCLDLNKTVIYLRLSSSHWVVHVRFFFA